MTDFLPASAPGMKEMIPSSVTKLVKRIDRLFFLLVFLPTLAASAYYGLIASDIYISESTFVIRKPSQQASSGLGLFLKSSGLSPSGEDNYIVRDYVMSRTALREIDKKLDLRRTFSSPDIDILNRFSMIDGDESFEALFKYYKKHVEVTIQSDSTIITLETRAFTGQDAMLINELLLELSEDLINRLNDRAMRDSITFAQREVSEAQASNRDAVLALSKYRNDHKVLDPEVQSSIPLQQVSRLQDDLVAALVQRSQIQSLAPNNPQIKSIDQRIALLRDQIQKGEAEVAGGNQSLASKASEYQRRRLDKEFSEKVLTGALSSLEQARNDVQRKQLYLDRIAEPNMPDKALEPKRLRSVAAVFLVGVMLWLIMTMVTAGIKEHQE